MDRIVGHVFWESWTAKGEETASDEEGVFISLPGYHRAQHMSLYLSWCFSMESGGTDHKGPLEGP